MKTISPLKRARLVSLLLVLAWSVSGPARGADLVEFNRDVRPILSENCFQCHGPDAKARKAKLRLDREANSRAA